MKRLVLLGVVLAVCAGAVHVGSAQALAVCGTISVSTTLTADCAAPLTVDASGITVDLGGHSVVCDTPAPEGIFVDPGVSNTTVRNGTVRPGLSACLEGVNVEGHSNRLTSLRAFGAIEGFVVGGESNTLLLVTASFNFDDGMAVFGSNGIIRQATLTQNGNGADFIIGTGNTITRSRSFLNTFTGITIGGNSTFVNQNQLFLNNTGIYLSGGSRGSTVALNQVYSNVTGIYIDGTSSDNDVVINGSFANSDVDMRDDNANCDSNLWFDNLFSTANQSCIR